MVPVRVTNWEIARENGQVFEWPAVKRLVVVSPHPDDETLGCGGLIALAVERGLEVLVVSVTNGEAGGDQQDARALSAIRIRELDRALASLGESGEVAVQRLGLPDGQVEHHEPMLKRVLVACLRASDLVCCPMIDDWHSDHEATARATTAAARHVGSVIRWFPIWGWVHGSAAARLPSRVELVSLNQLAHRRKLRALRCFESQLLGPNPVLSDDLLEMFRGPVEVLLRPDFDVFDQRGIVEER